MSSKLVGLFIGRRAVGSGWKVDARRERVARRARRRREMKVRAMRREVRRLCRSARSSRIRGWVGWRPRARSWRRSRASEEGDGRHKIWGAAGFVGKAALGAVVAARAGEAVAWRAVMSRAARGVFAVAGALAGAVAWAAAGRAAVAGAAKEAGGVGAGFAVAGVCLRTQTQTGQASALWSAPYRL